MFQRLAVLQAWEAKAATEPATLAASAPGRRRTGAAITAQQKAQSFFEMVRVQEKLCWDELVEEFRQNYYDAFDEVIPALFATDDPLVIHNCIRFADFSQAKEVEVLRKFIRDCDAEKHQVTLKALAEKRQPELLAALKRKRDLPESVREVLV